MTGVTGSDDAGEPFRDDDTTANPPAGEQRADRASDTERAAGGESDEGTEPNAGMDGEQMNGTGDGSGAGGTGSDGTDAGATKANGLTAAYYVPLRDVDPRIGVEMLAKL